jgi:hypothetical protein
MVSAIVPALISPDFLNVAPGGAIAAFLTENRIELGADTKLRR